MESEGIRVTEPVTPHLRNLTVSSADVWMKIAEDDNRLCRLFERRHNARLARSSRSQRVSWERHGETSYGVLLPDQRPRSSVKNDEWYLIDVIREFLEHRTLVERELERMIILAETAEDWVELLRQAVCRTVFDLRFEIAPHYINALGDIDRERCGFQITIEAHAPHEVCCDFHLTGLGSTPEDAARAACCKWLGIAPTCAAENSVVVSQDAAGQLA